jgi:hypothetical protein
MPSFRTKCLIEKKFRKLRKLDKIMESWNHKIIEDYSCLYAEHNVWQRNFQKIEGFEKRNKLLQNETKYLQMKHYNSKQNSQA